MVDQKYLASIPGGSKVVADTAEWTLTASTATTPAYASIALKGAPNPTTSSLCVEVHKQAGDPEGDAVPANAQFQCITNASNTDFRFKF
jgi:hypothetical protein